MPVNGGFLPVNLKPESIHRPTQLPVNRQTEKVNEYCPVKARFQVFAFS